MKSSSQLVLTFFLLITGVCASAQMALVQRTDLALGNDRKSYAEWLVKQGFNFDTEGQEQTRQMASGIAQVIGTRLYGETYLNTAGNIRIRLFTDTAFLVMQVQITLAKPLPGEGEKFIASLKTIGYSMESRYKNSNDGTDNCLLSKADRRFTIVESKERGYLLVKAAMIR